MVNDGPRRLHDRARFEQRLRTLGAREPRCAVAGCLETDPFALTGAAPRIVCYEHRASAEGRSWLEEHHLAGRSNSSATATTPGNDHRVLTELQAQWPRETLRNPDGSPLLRAAAGLRGWSDVQRVTLERIVAPLAVLLEALDAWLRTRLGTNWWREFEEWRSAHGP